MRFNRKFQIYFLLLQNTLNLIEKSRSIFILKEKMRFDRKIQIHFYYDEKHEILMKELQIHNGDFINYLRSIIKESFEHMNISYKI